MEDKIFRDQQQGGTIPRPTRLLTGRKNNLGGREQCRGGDYERYVGCQAGWPAVIEALGIWVLAIEKGRG